MTTSNTPQSLAASPSRGEIETIYSNIEAQAREQFASGTFRTDPYLADRKSDRRKGLTLIGRLDAPTTSRISDMTRRLAILEPDQYVYTPGELHLAVLTLVTAAEGFAQRPGDLAAFAEAVARSLAGARSIFVDFVGLVPAPDCVLAAGYPCDDTLEEIRARLRVELDAAGLGDSLDARYRIRIAHSTLFRFARPPRNLRRFTRALARLRDKPFGRCRFDVLHFVVNDWYMSESRTHTHRSYPLHKTKFVRD